MQIDNVTELSEQLEELCLLKLLNGNVDDMGASALLAGALELTGPHRFIDQYRYAEPRFQLALRIHQRIGNLPNHISKDKVPKTSTMVAQEYVYAWMAAPSGVIQKHAKVLANYRTKDESGRKRICSMFIPLARQKPEKLKTILLAAPDSPDVSHAFVYCAAEVLGENPSYLKAAFKT